MAKQSFDNETTQVYFGNDSIVIPKHIADTFGGRTLDVTEFEASVIKAGHVIITDGSGIYKPMPVKGEAYDTLPSGYKYCGVLYRTILKKKPSASILTWGTVNEVAAPYSFDAIKADFTAAVPHISFIKDEEA